MRLPTRLGWFDRAEPTTRAGRRARRRRNRVLTAAGSALALGSLAVGISQADARPWAGVIQLTGHQARSAPSPASTADEAPSSLAPGGTGGPGNTAPEPVIISEVAADSASDQALNVDPGVWIRPADGPVSSPFGMRLHPILKVWRLHDGEDLAAACGSPVRATRAGTVVTAGQSVAYGLVVVIDHGGGLQTLYGHMRSIGVRPGQTVIAGQQIAVVGSEGYSTGCHLHFGTWVNGRPVDPSSIVTFATGPLPASRPYRALSVKPLVPPAGATEFDKPDEPLPAPVRPSAVPTQPTPSAAPAQPTPTPSPTSPSTSPSTSPPASPPTTPAANPAANPTGGS